MRHSLQHSSKVHTGTVIYLPIFALPPPDLRVPRLYYPSFKSIPQDTKHIIRKEKDSTPWFGVGKLRLTIWRLTVHFTKGRVRDGSNQSPCGLSTLFLFQKPTSEVIAFQDTVWEKHTQADANHRYLSPGTHGPPKYILSTLAYMLKTIAVIMA